MKILFLISVLCAPVIALSTAQCEAGFVINCLFYCYDFSGRTLMAQTYPNTDDFQTTPLTLDNLAVLCPNTIRSIQIYDECTLDTCDTRQIAINTPIYTKRTAFFEQFCVKCTCKEKNACMNVRSFHLSVISLFCVECTRVHTPGPITWDGYYCCSGDDYSAKGNEFYSFQNKCLYDTSPLLDLDLTEINRFIHLFRIIRRQCVSPYTTRPWHPRFVTDYPHFTQWDGAKSALQHQLYHNGLTAEDMNPLNSLPSVLTTIVLSFSIIWLFILSSANLRTTPSFIESKTALFVLIVLRFSTTSALLSISTRMPHTCALQTTSHGSNGLQCLGYESTAMYRGRAPNEMDPLLPNIDTGINIEDIMQVATASNHICVLTATGKKNHSAQLRLGNAIQFGITMSQLDAYVPSESANPRRIVRFTQDSIHLASEGCKKKKYQQVPISSEKHHNKAQLPIIISDPNPTHGINGIVSPLFVFSSAFLSRKCKCAMLASLVHWLVSSVSASLQWSISTTPMPEIANLSRAAIASYNSTIWIFGGDGIREWSRLLSIDVSSNTVTQHPNNISFGAFTSRVYCQRDAVVFLASPSETIIAYDLSLQNEVYAIPKKNSTHDGSCCIITNDEYLFWIGGAKQDEVTKVFYIYDFNTMQWITGTPIPEARKHHSCDVVLDTLYVIGGSDRDSWPRIWYDAVIYIDVNDPYSNPSWNVFPASLSVARRQHRSLPYNQFIYVVGGKTGTANAALENVNAVEIIDTSQGNIWIDSYIVNATKSASMIMMDNVLFFFGGVPVTGNPYYQYAALPTPAPTNAPSTPSYAPSTSPTLAPTVTPTAPPTMVPTRSPSDAPSATPTLPPSEVPSRAPTTAPIMHPSISPSFSPTDNPLPPSAPPTVHPSMAPTIHPSISPTFAPTVPTRSPSHGPTISPTACHDYNTSYNSMDGTDKASMIAFDGNILLFNKSAIEADSYRQTIFCNDTDIDLCFIVCYDSFSCQDTTVIPHANPMINPQLRALKWLCFDERSCTNAMLNVTDIAIENVTIICISQLSCMHLNIEIDANYPTRFSLHCNESMSCADVALNLQIGHSYTHSTPLIAKVFCYKPDSCDSLHVYSDNEHSTNIDLEISLYQHSGNIVVHHAAFTEKNIVCGSSEEHRFIEYDTAALPNDADLLKLAANEYETNKLPCSGIKVECNADESCAMEYDVKSINLQKILQEREYVNCYWLDLNHLLTTKCKGNCDRDTIYYPYDVIFDMDIYVDIEGKEYKQDVIQLLCAKYFSTVNDTTATLHAIDTVFEYVLKNITSQLNMNILQLPMTALRDPIICENADENTMDPLALNITFIVESLSSNANQIQNLFNGSSRFIIQSQALISKFFGVSVLIIRNIDGYYPNTGNPLYMWYIAAIAAAIAILLLIILFCYYHRVKHAAEKMAIDVYNPMVVAYAIGTYTSNPHSDDIDKVGGVVRDLPLKIDIENSTRFCDAFGYHLHKHKDKKQDVVQWNEDEIVKDLEFQSRYLSKNIHIYDSLLVLVSCHGMEDGIITSDYKLIDKCFFHRSFTKKYPLSREIPRVFIFDCCSGNEQRVARSSMYSNERLPKGTMEEEKASEVVGEGPPTDKNREQYDAQQSGNMWQDGERNPDYRLVQIDAANKGFQSKLHVREGSYLITRFINKSLKDKEDNGKQFLYEIMDVIQQELHQEGTQQIMTQYQNKTRYIRFKANNKMMRGVTVEMEKIVSAQDEKEDDNYDDDDNVVNNDNVVDIGIADAIPEHVEHYTDSSDSEDLYATSSESEGLYATAGPVEGLYAAAGNAEGQTQLHSKRGATAHVPQDMRQCSTVDRDDEIQNFLGNIGMSFYFANFKRSHFKTTGALVSITDDVLRSDLKIKNKSHRIKILNAISVMNSRGNRGGRNANMSKGTSSSRYRNDQRQRSSATAITTFLGRINMQCYAKRFKRNGYKTLQSLSCIDDDTLRLTMKIEKVSDRKIILKAISSI